MNERRIEIIREADEDQRETDWLPSDWALQQASVPSLCESSRTPIDICLII